MQTLRLVGLLLGLLTGLAPRARGQASAACGSGRYADDQFTAVTKTDSLIYGYNSVRDYSTGIDYPRVLRLSFFEPTADVTTPQRPLIIFAFGGAFVTGKRSDMDDLCEAFARKGYATATITYRLIPPGPNGANYFLVLNSQARLADQIVRASSDMKAAVRFFRANAATYRIDPNTIIVAGYSAGAITALQTAYIDSETEDPNYAAAYGPSGGNGGLEGNTDLPVPLRGTYDARNLAGVFNLAGGVATLGVVSAGNPPLFSVHGDNDGTVPYNYGPVFKDNPFFTLNYNLYGSGAIHPQATTVGIANELYTIAGGSHGSPRQEPYRTTGITRAAQFFQTRICNAALPVVLAGFTGQTDPLTCAATLRWRSASEQGSRSYEVQRSADGQQFEVMGTVPSRNSPTGAAYAYEAGRLTAPAYFRLRLLDQDGTFTYSPVVSLAGTCAPALTLAPNPTTGRLALAGLPDLPCRATVYNAAGQRVAAATGRLALTLDLTALPPGLYLVQAATEAGQPLGQGRVVKQ